MGDLICWETLHKGEWIELISLKGEGEGWKWKYIGLKPEWELYKRIRNVTVACKKPYPPLINGHHMQETSLTVEVAFIHS